MQGRGRGRAVQAPVAAELEQLRQENERLRAQLEQAEIIIDVQKKLAKLLGLSTAESKSNERES